MFTKTTAIFSFSVSAFRSPVTLITLYIAETERERCSIVFSWCECAYRFVLYVYNIDFLLFFLVKMSVLIVFNKIDLCIGDIVISTLI